MVPALPLIARPGCVPGLCACAGVRDPLVPGTACVSLVVLAPVVVAPAA